MQASQQRVGPDGKPLPADGRTGEGWSPTPGTRARKLAATEAQLQEVQEKAKEMRQALQDVTQNLEAVRQARQAAEQQLLAAAAAGKVQQPGGVGLTPAELAAAELRRVSGARLAC